MAHRLSSGVLAIYGTGRESARSNPTSTTVELLRQAAVTVEQEDEDEDEDEEEEEEEDKEEEDEMSLAQMLALAREKSQQSLRSGVVG